MTLFLLIAVLPVGLLTIDSLRVAGRWSMAHYTGLWDDAHQIDLIVKSLLTAAASTGIAVLIGLPFAFLLARTDLPGFRVWRWLYLVPLCIPAHIHNLSWICVFGGPRSVTGSPVGMFGPGDTILISALAYYPFLVLPALCGFESMNRRFEDAARLLYPPWKVFKNVTLPLLTPYITAGAVFVFVFSILNCGVPVLLRGQIHSVDSFARLGAFYNPKTAVAQMLPLILIALLLLGLQRRAMGSRAYVNLDFGDRRTGQIRLGRSRLPALMFVGALMLLSVFAPIAGLTWHMGSIKGIAAALRASVASLSTSLMLSLLAATLTVALSYFLSAAIENGAQRRRKLLDYLSFVPLAIPAALIGIGLIYFWNGSWTGFIYQTAAILIIAYLARFMTFSVQVLNAGRKQICPGLLEAALVCQPSWWKRTLRIDLPFMLRGLAAAWAVVFILCMGELGTTQAVIPNGRETLALKINTLINSGAEPEAALLSLVLVAVNLFLAGTVVLILRRLRCSPFIVHHP